MNPALALVMLGLVIINLISVAALAWSGRVLRYGDTAVERCLRAAQQDMDRIEPPRQLADRRRALTRFPRLAPRFCR